MTLIFIAGNLAANHLLHHISPIAAAACCASALVITIALLITVLHNPKPLLPLFIPIFLLLGILNSGYASMLGEYQFIEGVATSAAMLDLRELFSARLGTIVPAGEMEVHSLLKALTMGEKGDIPQHLKEAYRLSGAMHLLALSGLHVGFIYAMLSKGVGLLPVFKGKRWIKSVAIILLLGFYTIFTGASPSICRAFLMAAIYEIGNLAGRRNNGLNALSTSALLISLADPQAPSSISFQLSFSAMMGIFLVKPHFDAACKTVTSSKIALKILGLCSLSLSCQLLTTPLTYLYFGSFPLISLLTNLLAMPVISAVLAIAPGAILFANVPILGEWSATILSFAIQTLNLLMEVLSRIL